jgi:hypothetical protein
MTKPTVPNFGPWVHHDGVNVPSDEAVVLVQAYDGSIEVGTAKDFGPHWRWRERGAFWWRRPVCFNDRASPIIKYRVLIAPAPSRPSIKDAK